MEMSINPLLLLLLLRQQAVPAAMCFVYALACIDLVLC